MIAIERINKAKEVPILDYLAAIGHQPVSQYGNEILYHSPIRNEKTASFYVNVIDNVFIDFGLTSDTKNSKSQIGGDTIKLVQCIQNCSFAKAVEILEVFTGTPKKDIPVLPVWPVQSKVENDGILSIKPLHNKALIEYLTSRGISYERAFRYVNEVYYTHKEKNYFALGFRNNKNGFELRAKVGGFNVKRSLGPKWITTIEIEGSKTVNVFEGFFDFLSALEYYNLSEPRNTTIVLNSTANLEKALPYLSQYQRINTYFDLDTAGINSTYRLLKENLPIADRSLIYRGFKDFNEFLLHRQTR